MKKLLTLLTVAAAAIANPAQAQVTDVSTLDNVVYIEPVTLMAGTTANLSVQMKNTVGIVGYQCDIIFPEGVSPVLNEDDLPLVSLSTDRTSASRHSLDSKIQSDGSIRLLSGSTNVLTYRGNEGEVGTIAVQVDGDMEPGEYTIKMSYVKLVSKDDGDFGPYNLETTLTIIANDGKVHLDENSRVAPKSTTSSTDIVMKRTFVKDQWSTICLPFNMSAIKLAETFGTCQLASLDSYTIEKSGNEIIGITVNFKTTEKIDANIPYIIKLNQDITEFEVKARMQPAASQQKVIMVYDEDEDDDIPVGYMNGTFVAQTTVPAKNLFLADNKFWYSTGKTKIKAYRAYFELSDVLSSVNTEDVSGVKFNFVLDNNPTAIDFIDGEVENGAIYDLSGRKIQQPKQRGIYIVNGKKVAVK